MCPYPLSLRVPLYAPQPGVIMWYHGQDDDLACGHSVSLVLSPGAVYQQTFELLLIRSMGGILSFMFVFFFFLRRVTDFSAEALPIGVKFCTAVLPALAQVFYFGEAAVLPNLICAVRI